MACATFQHTNFGVSEFRDTSIGLKVKGLSYDLRCKTLHKISFIKRDAHTAPYMHNGNFEELQNVLEFYEDILSGISQNPLVPNHDLVKFAYKIDIKVKDMGLIISFFNSLNNEDFDRSIPNSVPSKLSVGVHIY